MAIVAELDENGKEIKWNGHLVSRFEVNQRQRSGIPPIQRGWLNRQRFRFSVCSGDAFILEKSECPVQIYIARSLSEGKIEYVAANDARLKADIKKAKAWTTRSPNELRKLGFRKVMLSPLGEVIPCND